MIKGEKRIRLNYSLDPVPTIYPKDYIPQSSILPSSASKQQRKPPKNRRIPDEYNDFVQRDKIHKLDQLDESCAPFDFEFKRFDDHVYFRIEFNKNFVPGVKESIVVDKDLHVKLFYEGSHVPLPEWFRQGQDKTRRQILSWIKGSDEFGKDYVDEIVVERKHLFLERGCW